MKKMKIHAQVGQTACLSRQLLLKLLKAERNGEGKDGWNIEPGTKYVYKVSTPKYLPTHGCRPTESE